MTRTIAMIVLVAALAACDRNPEGSERSEPATAAQPAPGQPGQLPPGHPPTQQELPQGHPPLGPTGQGAAQAGQPGEPTAGGIVWEVPHSFEPQPPKSRMRAAQYRIAGEGGKDDAELVAYYFGPGQGGSVQENVDRWVGQFDSPEGSETEKREVEGMTVTVVDVTGTYKGMQMPGQPAPSAEDNQRMLAAIVEGPKGPVFFKLVGPEPVVESAEEAFDQMVESVEKK